MPSIFTLNARFRAALLRQERATALELVRAYQSAWKSIQKDVDGILLKIAAARESGQEVNTSWLYNKARLESLQRQIEREVRKFAAYSDGRISHAQEVALNAALQHAPKLIESGLGNLPDGISFSFNRLPKEAVENLVGFASDGSPLRALLDKLGPEASAGIRDSLISGVASGRSVKSIAREIRQRAGMPLTRALTISRTETLRAYRTASHESYRRNSDVVKGWVWTSALERRTCPGCWAMHGTVHSLDESLDDHPQGRCTPVPITKSWAELGIEGVGEVEERIESGAEAFERLSPADKRAILGTRRYQLYSSGQASLTDMVGRRYDAQWGSSIYVRPAGRVAGV